MAEIAKKGQKSENLAQFLGQKTMIPIPVTI
jgi:hypothetical protein